MFTFGICIVIVRFVSIIFVCTSARALDARISIGIDTMPTHSQRDGGTGSSDPIHRMQLWPPIPLDRSLGLSWAVGGKPSNPTAALFCAVYTARQHPHVPPHTAGRRLQCAALSSGCKGGRSERMCGRVDVRTCGCADVWTCGRTGAWTCGCVRVRASIRVHMFGHVCVSIRPCWLAGLLQLILHN